MKIVTVIPLQKSSFKDELTYFTSQNIALGDIVDISVRKKNILGFVISSEEIKGNKSDIKNMPFNLKKIQGAKKNSIFLKEFLESTFLIGKYFVSKRNLSISSLIPSVFLEKYDDLSKTKNLTKIKENTSENIKSEKLLFQAPISSRIDFYKILIRSSFAEKKSIFIILPNEHDINIFSEMLSKGIENFTFSIHGNLSPKKQIEKFKEIISSSHPVLILGTAPFLSIPRRDLETIIVENENTNAYKMISRPYFDLRIFAEIYASKINAKLILSDSLLRFESIARKELDNFSEVHPLSYKINFEGKIEIPEKQKEFKILEDSTIKEIQDRISNKENIFIFSLRKGLATMTVCRDCNEIVNCDQCQSPLVLYISNTSKKRLFICNRCRKEKNPETTCSRCGSWNLISLGVGTDTVFEEIKKIFKKTKIFKLDKEIAKNTSGAEKIINEFEKEKGAILIGTEMALYYIKDKIPLSIVASFDSLWSIPNFKMSEKIVKLLTSIISKTKNKLIIQTKNAEDSAILAVKNENLSSFIKEELEDRKNLNYPPFNRFIKISHLGNKDEIENTKKYLEEIFSGFIAKIKDKYVTNMLIKLNYEKWSLPELSNNASVDENLLNKLLSLPKDFLVKIDPEDII